MAIELSVETFQKFGGGCIIRWESVIGLDKLLDNSIDGKNVEVTGLDRNCLVVQSSSLQLSRDETWSPLVCVFQSDIRSNRAAFKKNEAIVVLDTQSASQCPEEKL